MKKMKPVGLLLCFYASALAGGGIGFYCGYQYSKDKTREWMDEHDIEIVVPQGQIKAWRPDGTELPSGTYHVREEPEPSPSAR
jgi:hypothetical protein